VERGKVLARLDDEDLRNRVALAQAYPRIGAGGLDKLLAGSRPEEIREAAAGCQSGKNLILKTGRFNMNE